MINEAGNKIPDNYEGAFEKHLREQREKGIKPAVRSLLPAAADQEHLETAQTRDGQIFSLVQHGPPRTAQENSSPVFSHSTGWEPLANDDDDDDTQMVKALNHIAHHVSQGPKLSQKSQRSKIPPKKKPYTEAQIKQIVAKNKIWGDRFARSEP